jgi:carbamoyltransferase
MNILGITDSITSGAAIVSNGAVLAAVSEERLNRHKMSMGFPLQSIGEVLRLSGLEPTELDGVAVATEHLFWRPKPLPFTDYFRSKKGGFRDLYLSMGAAVSTVAGNSALARKSYYGLKSALTRTRPRQIKEVLRSQFGIEAPITFLDHHLCHAASAYFTSGFQDALVITHDGAGDGKCSSVYAVSKGAFQHLNSLDSYDSVGNYYAYVTHLCGFQAHKHEGKITGLAAYGQPRYIDLLRRYVSHGDGAIVNRGKCFDHSAITKLTRELGENFSHADLSASVQLLLEETVAEYVDYWVRRSGLRDVALAGGVFANVKLNQRVHELDSVDRVFVHPGMGDEGLGVGAALFECSQRLGYQSRPVIQDVYLGAGYSDAECLDAIEANGLSVIGDGPGIERKAAGLIAAGKIVARCAGRMEYGPRALGNRSILYQATDRSVNTWLNERLKRTEFMPFAPVVLWEERARCFTNVDGAADTARFMTITFDCQPELKERCPAICHVDGTARPQLIREQDNPGYYHLVKEYQSLTGLPCMVNTSFNMHEEPIVNTPREAVKSFLQSRLDALILGKYLVAGPDLDATRQLSAERSDRTVAVV